MKYKLTNETKEWHGHTLHRIQALKDFGHVKAYEKGGWVEREFNLSQEGNCWIFGEGKAYGRGMVIDNATIHAYAQVYGDATITGYAMIMGGSRVYDNAHVYDYAQLYGNASVYGYADVFGHADIYDDSEIYEHALVFDYADVCNGSNIHGCAEVGGNATITDADVTSNKDYIVFKNWWSSGRFFTWTKSDNKWRVGCFFGTGEELIAKAYNDSKKKGREYEKIVRYVETILNEAKVTPSP